MMPGVKKRGYNNSTENIIQRLSSNQPQSIVLGETNNDDDDVLDSSVSPLLHKKTPPQNIISFAERLKTFNSTRMIQDILTKYSLELKSEKDESFQIVFNKNPSKPIIEASSKSKITASLDNAKAILDEADFLALIAASAKLSGFNPVRIMQCPDSLKDALKIALEKEGLTVATGPARQAVNEIQNEEEDEESLSRAPSPLPGPSAPPVYSAPPAPTPSLDDLSKEEEAEGRRLAEKRAHQTFQQPKVNRDANNSVSQSPSSSLRSK